jgi:hypothetical protein
MRVDGTIDNESTMADLDKQLKEFLRPYVVYTNYFHVNEWGRKDLSLESLKRFPCILVHELMRTSPPEAKTTWAYAGDKKASDRWYTN